MGMFIKKNLAKTFARKYHESRIYDSRWWLVQNRISLHFQNSNKQYSQIKPPATRNKIRMHYLLWKRTGHTLHALSAQCCLHALQQKPGQVPDVQNRNWWFNQDFQSMSWRWFYKFFRFSYILNLNGKAKDCSSLSHSLLIINAQSL
jgi:hypothetical protein